MLVFNKICQFYQQRCLFNEFSLQIKEPRVLISGANGSGKTTLLLMAAGLVKPQSGDISFNQQDVLQANIKRQIGISASKIALPAFMTVDEILQFHRRQFACSCYDKWLKQFGLNHYLPTKVADLSLGNVKKLSLMTAIMHQPELLLLDEPTNGLDEQARLSLNLLISEYPGQVIIASHEALAAEDQQVRHIQLQRG
ncbi:ABC transporter ATP-binding protein [Neptunicella sp. SCSIO 80796]|uniref:ABC transporter ATP-binding protein n=1 Tax=Neptunicella plasticusilytica TaxID=3117012 RepID=UPI003A4D3AF5